MKFCQAIQIGSPIDLDVIPYPGDMGGLTYEYGKLGILKAIEQMQK